MSRFLGASVALLLAFLAMPSAGIGQAQRTVPLDRLPPNTYAVLIWHGQPAIAKGAATNNLVRLWNDPDFLSVRRLFSQSLAGAGTADAKGGAKRLSQADQDALIEAIGNPGIVGAAGAFDFSTLFDDAAKKAQPASKDSDLFMIWDAAGKEAQWQKIDQLAQNPDRPATVTSLKLKGIDVRRSELPTRVSFTGMVGPWRVETGRQSLFEDLVGRLQGAAAPATSFIQSPLYAEAQKFRADSTLLEFLVKMPNLSTIKSPASGSFNVAAFLQGMKMDRVRGLVGSVGLAGSGTLMRTAILGDTSAGSVFDFFGASTPTFGTLAAAPAGYSYNASKVDFGAFYRTLRGALKASMSPDSFANLEMVEGMAAAQMQMSLADLLGSIEEFASVTPMDAVTTDIGKVTYAFRVKRSSDFLSLLKMGAGEMITGESVEGGATYLTLATPVSPMHVAAGPTLLVVAPTRELARGAIARAVATTPQPGSLAADANFQKGRALFPAALTSLSYSDMRKMPWQTLLGELTSAMPASSKDPERDKLVVDVVTLLPPLLTRYLRSSSSAGWKAPGGVFFEGRID